MARSRNHFCHAKVTVRSICVVVDIPVTTNKVNSLTVAMEKQERTPLALLSGYKIFRPVFKNTKILISASTVPILLSGFNQIWSFSTDC